MTLEFTVQTRIQKPVAEVFDAVYSPEKLNTYFTRGNCKGALEAGETVHWQFGHVRMDPIPVHVKASEKNKRIVFEWPAFEPEVLKGEDSEPYNVTVEMTFEALSPSETLVKITESGWRDERRASVAGSYQNCSGWTQMLACLKAWIEQGYIMGMDGCSHS